MCPCPPPTPPTPPSPRHVLLGRKVSRQLRLLSRHRSRQRGVLRQLRGDLGLSLSDLRRLLRVLSRHRGGGSRLGGSVSGGVGRSVSTGGRGVSACADALATEVHDVADANITVASLVQVPVAGLEGEGEGEGEGDGGAAGKAGVADARIPSKLGESYSLLFFELYYITDELVFFAHRYEGHGQRFAFKLASLLYVG